MAESHRKDSQKAQERTINLRDDAEETESGMYLNLLADEPGEAEAAMVLNSLVDDPEDLKQDVEELINKSRTR